MSEEAKKKLADVPIEQNFRMNTGAEIRNLNELLSTLKGISEETFRKHVNDEKNDFATWIRHSVGDRELAEKLMETKELEATQKAVEESVIFLQKNIELEGILKNIKGAENIQIDGDKQLIEEQAAKIKALEGELKTAEMNEQRPANAELTEPSPAGIVKNATAPVIEHTTIYRNIDTLKGSLTEELHPVQSFKRSLLITVRDILFGFVIGFVSGAIVSHYLWK